MILFGVFESLYIFGWLVVLKCSRKDSDTRWWQVGVVGAKVIRGYDGFRPFAVSVDWEALPVHAKCPQSTWSSFQ